MFSTTSTPTGGGGSIAINYRPFTAEEIAAGKPKSFDPFNWGGATPEVREAWVEIEQFTRNWLGFAVLAFLLWWFLRKHKGGR
jgi:hypothetical protein